MCNIYVVSWKDLGSRKRGIVQVAADDKFEAAALAQNEYDWKSMKIKQALTQIKNVTYHKKGVFYVKEWEEPDE